MLVVVSDGEWVVSAVELAAFQVLSDTQEDRCNGVTGRVGSAFGDRQKDRYDGVSGGVDNAFGVQ